MNNNKQHMGIYKARLSSEQVDMDLVKKAAAGRYIKHKGEFTL